MSLTMTGGFSLGVGGGGCGVGGGFTTLPSSNPYPLHLPPLSPLTFMPFDVVTQHAPQPIQSVNPMMSVHNSLPAMPAPLSVGSFESEWVLQLQTVRYAHLLPTKSMQSDDPLLDHEFGSGLDAEPPLVLCSTCQLQVADESVILTSRHRSADRSGSEPVFIRHLHCAQAQHLESTPDPRTIPGFAALAEGQQEYTVRVLRQIRARGIVHADLRREATMLTAGGLVARDVQTPTPSEYAPTPRLQPSQLQLLQAVHQAMQPAGSSSNTNTSSSPFQRNNASMHTTLSPLLGGLNTHSPAMTALSVSESAALFAPSASSMATQAMAFSPLPPRSSSAQGMLKRARSVVGSITGPSATLPSISGGGAMDDGTDDPVEEAIHPGSSGSPDDDDLSDSGEFEDADPSGGLEDLDENDEEAGDEEFASHGDAASPHSPMQSRRRSPAGAAAALDDARSPTSQTRRKAAMKVIDNANGVGADGSRRKRTKKDPSAPKRPTSNYMFWCAHRRPALRALHPDLPSNVLMQKIALEWKTQPRSAAEKRMWMDMQERDQARYKRQMDQWKATGRYTEEPPIMPNGPLAEFGLAPFPAVMSPPPRKKPRVNSAAAVPRVSLPPQTPTPEPQTPSVMSPSPRQMPRNRRLAAIPVHGHGHSSPASVLLGSPVALTHASSASTSASTAIAATIAPTQSYNAFADADHGHDDADEEDHLDAPIVGALHAHAEAAEEAQFREAKQPHFDNLDAAFADLR